jgi:hypothetical protein
MTGMFLKDSGPEHKLPRFGGALESKNCRISSQKWKDEKQSPMRGHSFESWDKVQHRNRRSQTLSWLAWPCLG